MSKLLQIMRRENILKLTATVLTGLLLVPLNLWADSPSPEQNDRALHNLIKTNDRKGITDYFQKYGQDDPTLGKGVLRVGQQYLKVNQFLKQTDTITSEMTQQMKKFVTEKDKDPSYYLGDRYCPLLESENSEGNCYVLKTFIPNTHFQYKYELKNDSKLSDTMPMPDDVLKQYVAGLQNAVLTANAFGAAEQKKANGQQQQWSTAQKVCKERKLGVLGNITGRIERNLGHGTVLVKLVGTNANLCGTPAQVQEMTQGEPYLPVTGLSNPQPEHCGKVFVRNLRKIKVQYDDGFTGEAMLWQALSKKEVDALPRQLNVIDKFDPTWGYCP